MCSVRLIFINPQYCVLCCCDQQEEKSDDSIHKNARIKPSFVGKRPYQAGQLLKGCASGSAGALVSDDLVGDPVEDVEDEEGQREGGA